MHFADRYLQLVPIINSCLAEVRWQGGREGLDREERDMGVGREGGEMGRSLHYAAGSLVKLSGDKLLVLG